jgi:polyisoprenoid-binding protein YceI
VDRAGKIPKLEMRELLSQRLSKRRALCIVLLLVAFLTGSGGSLFGQNPAGGWSIDTSRSRLIVHVLPAGLLSSALHAHHFQPDEWSGEVAWDPEHPRKVRLEVRVAAGSLRDHQPKLSAKDRAKVEGQARGADILDSAKFPQILFQAQELELERSPSGGDGDFRGTLKGALTLHGKTLPLGIPIQGKLSGDRFEASATASFKQSDFGIKPYSTALGTVAVKDEITVEISLAGVPADRKASAVAPPARSRR